MQSKTFNEFNNVQSGQESYETKYFSIFDEKKNKTKNYRFYA